MAKEYVDIATLKYLLYQVHGVEDLLTAERFQDYDKDSLDLFINAIKEFSDRELFPYFKEMDETPAIYKNGTIMVHKQVDVMMKKGGEMGIISGPFDYGDGGLQLPFIIHTASAYIQEAANNHLPGYAGLTQGAAELIVHFANENLKKTYVPKMLSGAWGGTMCLTEPQAGSSLSDITTKATPTQEGYYKISGQKIFISGGDHQYAENVVHLLLARIEGAPSGTKGISLFVVPKLRMGKDGRLTNNDVMTVADFQKMGQRGYATTHLGFGDKDDCHGWLVGQAHKGLKYMFLMMNSARISVGRGGAAISMAAYQASLEYAKERPQGRKLSSDGKKDPDEKPCLIIEHPDVRRMLLLQKAIAEGSLSLVLLAAKYYDIIQSTKDPETKAKYGLLLEMIIPIVKTYPTEAGTLSVSNGVQVLGGYGFCSDFILQQYYRDIRIFSIYEGTTGIQSQDLLGRKVPMENGKALELLLTEILHTITEAMEFDELRSSAKILGDKIKLTRSVLDFLVPFAKKGNYERFLSDANLFMEFLSHVVIGWLWLDIAVNAQRNILGGDQTYSKTFYESKIHTMKFYFKYELPKTGSLAESLMHPDVLTTNSKKEVF
ncbi:acyl-CoA dehydrogenase [Arenibacter algicola]|uniref:3-methylmercaptopropionyl-CoA dehydrogenase n=1 Tax=Arenibacter algicola TaxID=616991 RepID=A0A221V2V2_9FLAO|nr:acyl-CoA dehydrogenase [Arenibacter algicola]ASO07873.1 3-methylmercaptopropionyl-CoA dehydrogenase [Arenibacter algicola]|tara:strand:- start:36877 stop:38688 length:1812 start_codon:yes stop_codon:yes gene_type:complete